MKKQNKFVKEIKKIENEIGRDKMKELYSQGRISAEELKHGNSMFKDIQARFKER